MLQKVDKDRLDEVLNVIQDRKIKFPLATIVKTLGADQALVSKILNGKKPMPDKFYTNFMEHFAGKKREVKADDIEKLQKDIVFLLEHVGGAGSYLFFHEPV